MLSEARLLSFRWLRGISPRLAEELRLVELVAVYEGDSRHAGTSIEPKVRISRDEVLKSARTLRGALIDIDHALIDPATRLRAPIYRARYGIDITGPVGQVIDAEAEYNEEVGRLSVEGVASIWDEGVYRLAAEGRFRGCSVVQQYRAERCYVDSSLHVCEAKGTYYPMVTLVLEGVPAFPLTSVRPLDPRRLEPGGSEEIIVPTPLAGLSIRYRFSGGVAERVLEDAACPYAEAPPSGLIEPGQGDGYVAACSHEGFLRSLPLIGVVKASHVPAQLYIDLYEAAEAETRLCVHRQLLERWRPRGLPARIPASAYLSFAYWLAEELGSPRPLHGAGEGVMNRCQIHPQGSG